MLTDPFAIAADIFDPPQWEPKDRNPLGDHQKPPAGIPGKDWQLWLLEAGRGAGKTEACARYFCAFMRAHPGARGRIIAPTLGDAVEACIEGPSGILAIDPEARWVAGAAGGSKIYWPNGSQALVLGTHTKKDVDRLRAGGNRHLDWWEESAANNWLKEAWDQAAFGLRLGEFPHSIMSTTPRSTKAYKAIRKMAKATKSLTKASMFDNLANLSAEFIKTMKEKYEGTRLGRQELYGELLEDVEGALWKRGSLDLALFRDALPDMAVSVTAIDPAATSKADADDTGIIVAGIGLDGWGYVLADRTCHLDPTGWGRRAVEAYREFRCDRIVAEVNNGGEMVRHVIETIDPNVPFKAVHASRGKATRAEPVSALYGELPSKENGQQGRDGIVRHVGGLSELEDQLTTWVPGDEDSPDRLDALVWALTDLFFEEHEEEEYVEEWEPVQIGVSL